MRKLISGNVSDTTDVIEAGSRKVQRSWKINLKDICLNNGILPLDIVKVFIKETLTHQIIDVGEVRVLNDYRIIIDDEKIKTKIPERSYVTVYIIKLDSPLFQSKSRMTQRINKFSGQFGEIEAGQRIIDRQGLVTLKYIFKEYNINEKDEVFIWIRIPGQDNIIKLGKRRVLKGYRIIIRNILKQNNLKKDDVIVVYISKIRPQSNNILQPETLTI